MLGNRDLFGRLAATAMLPAMEQVVAEWEPDVVLREPCEYASAVVAGRHSIRTAQVAISLAAAELGSIMAAAPALEAHRTGLVGELRGSPYLTHLPSALDPSPFPSTFRFREPEPAAVPALPDWWNGSDAPLVSLTFGTVLGHMSMAADVYRTALRAVDGLPVRVLLTIGRKIDPDDHRTRARQRPRRTLGRPEPCARPGRARRLPRRVGDRVRRPRGGRPARRRPHVLGSVRERAPDRRIRSRCRRRAGELGHRGCDQHGPRGAAASVPARSTSRPRWHPTRTPTSSTTSCSPIPESSIP